MATGTPVMSRLRARREIAYGLADLRDAQGVSQADVARQLRCSPGQVGMVESQDRVPNEEFLNNILALYGREDLLPGYLELREAARKREPEWRGITNTSYVPGFDDFVSLESAAERSETYETRLVPGLLQTKQYAWAALQAARSKADLDRKLEIRMHRQEAVIREDNPVHLLVILEEAALTRPVGSPAIMREQVEHLLTMAGRSEGNVQIQICPHSVGAHVGVAIPFTLLRFTSPRDPGIVAVETPAETSFFERPSEINRFELELDYLRMISLNPNDSAAFLETLKKEV